MKRVAYDAVPEAFVRVDNNRVVERLGEHEGLLR